MRYRPSATARLSSKRTIAGIRDVVLVCPQERDFALIEAARLRERYRIRAVGPDLDAHEADPRHVVEQATAVPADGAIGTKDRSALLAALVTERLALPGPTPHALVACQDKAASRELQRRVVPEATPRFARLDGLPAFEPPFFVKPVVGRLSQLARRIEDPAELAALPAHDPYRDGYAAIAELAGFPPERFRGYVAEELVQGDEVTLEGYVHGGRVTVIGVTDSVKYAGTNSFERFEYPSRLAAGPLDELAGVARRLLPAFGFDGGFFNVEFFVPHAGRAKIIEVNGRIASQFAPLVQAVHGRSTYDLLFALACGDDPGWQAGHPEGAAVSHVVRVFEDAFVASVPEPDDNVEILARPGHLLSEQGANDVRSFRLAIVYAAGATRAEALENARARARRLSFRLEPARARQA